MICPACDNILNAAGCQSCGWKTGDPWPAARLVMGAAHPLKDRSLYPPPGEVVIRHGVHDMAELRDKVDADPEIPLSAKTGFKTVIIDGPTEVTDHLPVIDINSPLVETQTIEYADGSSATGPGPLPIVSPGGSPAVSIDGVPIVEPPPASAKTSKKSKAETIQ